MIRASTGLQLKCLTKGRIGGKARLSVKGETMPSFDPKKELFHTSIKANKTGRLCHIHPCHVPHLELVHKSAVQRPWPACRGETCKGFTSRMFRKQKDECGFAGGRNRDPFVARHVHHVLAQYNFFWSVGQGLNVAAITILR
jgi:hypothetical protein